jgi:hypothetical protein
MNKEVEILKIGSIMPIIPILGSTYQFRKTTIMVVYDGGKLFDYYIDILKKNCDEYSYQRTAQSIVGSPFSFKPGVKLKNILKGISDENPVIGQSYTINNSSWHTSKVERIIDGCILITKNSVYAIHNLSDVREKKLEDLGL